MSVATLEEIDRRSREYILQINTRMAGILERNDEIIPRIRSKKPFKKEDLWYRGNYGRILPVPVEYNLRGQIWHPDKPANEQPQQLIAVDEEEALFILFYTGDERSKDSKSRGPCTLIYDIHNVRWNKLSLFREMRDHPLSKKDIDDLIESKAKFTVNYGLVGHGSTSWEKGIPMFSFNSKIRGTAREIKLTIIHELLHGVFRIGTYFYQRGYNNPKGFTVEDLIEREANKILETNPRLVDYAIQRFGIPLRSEDPNLPF